VENSFLVCLLVGLFVGCRPAPKEAPPPVCSPVVTPELHRVLPTAVLEGCGEGKYGEDLVKACFWHTSRDDGDCHAIVYSLDKCATWHTACRCATKAHPECALDGTLM
jgi:hypothetical protein